MLTSTDRNAITVSPIGETGRDHTARVVGRIGVDLPDGHRDFDLVDEPVCHNTQVLPFASAWLFEPVTYLCWQQVSAALELQCRTGRVRFNGQPFIYGCWLIDLTVEQATAVATLTGRPELLLLTAGAVSLYPEGVTGPSISFGWLA